jgi:hypothetical protein
MRNTADFNPLDFGLKLILIEYVPDCLTTLARLTNGENILASAPTIAILDIFRFAVPMFEIVIILDAERPTFTFPKS